jgi:hypothetical protein
VGAENVSARKWVRLEIKCVRNVLELERIGAQKFVEKLAGGKVNRKLKKKPGIWSESV